MAKIDNYQKDQAISLEDKVVGTDAEDSKSTKNYLVRDLFLYFNKLNNKKSSSYQYSSVDADTANGKFNIDGGTNTVKFSEKDLQDENNSDFFLALKDNANTLLLSLKSGVNDFSYFTVNSVARNLNSFSFVVTPVGTTTLNSFTLDDNYNLSIDVITSGQGASVQADWNQSDSNQADYIKNKPTLFSGSYNDLTNTPTLFSGNYNDLSNKPTLFSGSYNDLKDKPRLFSGNFNDLLNKPTIPAEQIQSDWNQTDVNAKDFIKNKPTIGGGSASIEGITSTGTIANYDNVVTIGDLINLGIGVKVSAASGVQINGARLVNGFAVYILDRNGALVEKSLVSVNNNVMIHTGYGLTAYRFQKNRKYSRRICFRFRLHQWSKNKKKTATTGTTNDLSLKATGLDSNVDLELPLKSGQMTIIDTINTSTPQTSATLNASHPLAKNPIGTQVINLDNTQRYTYTRVSNTAWRRSEIMTDI